MPPLAAVLLHASILGGSRLRRGHAAARLRASASTRSFSSLQEGKPAFTHCKEAFAAAKGMAFKVSKSPHG